MMLTTLFLASLLVAVCVGITHTYRLQVTAGSGDSLSSTLAPTGGAETNLTETLAIGTNTLVAFVLDVSQCKAIYIMASTAMTLKTNSSGSPAQTLTLNAGEAIVWVSTYDSDIPHPFGSTDVTALYCTQVAESILYIRCLYDPTV